MEFLAKPHLIINFVSDVFWNKYKLTYNKSI